MLARPEADVFISAPTPILTLSVMVIQADSLVAFRKTLGDITATVNSRVISEDLVVVFRVMKKNEKAAITAQKTRPIKIRFIFIIFTQYISSAPFFQAHPGEKFVPGFLCCI